MARKIISCDWGTSSLRLRLVDVSTAAILAEISSSDGISTVYREWQQSNEPEHRRFSFFKRKLLEKLQQLHSDELAGLPIFVSGMASSSIGMMEMPYNRLPFSLTGDRIDFHKAICSNEEGGHELFVFSGVSSLNDVMRGEEIQLMGMDPNISSQQRVILPGTHSKHAMLNNKSLVQFTTYMTGEFFDLLLHHSVLAGSVEKPTGNFDADAFSEGLLFSRENNLLHAAFVVRTRQLLERKDPKKNYEFLSGLLIGSELGELHREQVSALTLIATPDQALRYRQALESLLPGVPLSIENASECFVKGHCLLAQRFC